MSGTKAEEPPPRTTTSNQRSDMAKRLRYDIASFGATLLAGFGTDAPVVNMARSAWAAVGNYQWELAHAELRAIAKHLRNVDAPYSLIKTAEELAAEARSHIPVKN